MLLLLQRWYLDRENKKRDREPLDTTYDDVWVKVIDDDGQIIEKRVDKVSLPIHNSSAEESPAEYARQLQKDLDYVQSTNYATSIAMLSSKFQKLVNLLEWLDLPPMYERSI